MEQIIAMFKKDNFAKACGIEIMEVGSGFAKCTMEVTTGHLNGIGILMGGALFTLGDFTFSLAANSHGIIAVTHDASITYIRKCVGGTVTAVATEISRNDKSGNYSVRITNDEDEIIAEVNGTTSFMRKSLIAN
jgi:acyl-CoA thioesterase